MLRALPALSEETNFQEIFADIWVNGELVARNALLLQQDGGVFSSRTADLEDWRLMPPANGNRFFHGAEEFIPLSAFPGLTTRLDQASMVLYVETPPDQFEKTILFRRPDPIAPQGGNGAYLNYDFVLNVAEGIDPTINGVVDLVIFQPQKLGILDNNFLVSGGNGDFRFTRLETTLTKDLVDKKQSIRLGDSFTAASGLSRPTRFGGIQWATNFSVDPTFISQ